MGRVVLVQGDKARPGEDGESKERDDERLAHAKPITLPTDRSRRFDEGRRGYFTSRRGSYENVEVMGLYWHFVDLVWVFIFAFFYLW